MDHAMKNIKVNFRFSPEDVPLYGPFEGMHVLVENDVYARVMDNDKSTGETFGGILNNDSVFMPWLSHGIAVEFTTDGIYRPYANVSDLEGRTPDLALWAEAVAEVG